MSCRAPPIALASKAAGSLVLVLVSSCSCPHGGEQSPDAGRPPPVLVAAPSGQTLPPPEPTGPAFCRGLPSSAFCPTLADEPPPWGFHTLDIVPNGSAIFSVASVADEIAPADTLRVMLKEGAAHAFLSHALVAHVSPLHVELDVSLPTPIPGPVSLARVGLNGSTVDLVLVDGHVRLALDGAAPLVSPAADATIGSAWKHVHLSCDLEDGSVALRLDGRSVFHGMRLPSRGVIDQRVTFAVGLGVDRTSRVLEVVYANVAAY